MNHELFRTTHAPHGTRHEPPHSAGRTISPMQAPRRERVTPPDTIEARFEQFHEDNPHVYQTLASAARRCLATRPGSRLSIKMLWEVVRYKQLITETADTYALNNNYTALYARRLMENEDDLAGVFETRERRAA